MISHAHRTIFVHIPKAAGQSIERTFVARLGLTWEAREPLLLGRNPDPGRGPQFLGHLYAAEYRDLGYVTPAQFDSYFKFAVVRNPYARILSEYRYRSPAGRTSFDRFWTSRPTDEHLNATRHVVPQHRYLYSGDQLLVDQVVKFETLTREWPHLSQRLFGEVVPLPHANAARATAARDVQLDDNARTAIAERYRQDFECFGYSTEAVS